MKRHESVKLGLEKVERCITLMLEVGEDGTHEQRIDCFEKFFAENNMDELLRDLVSVEIQLQYILTLAQLKLTLDKLGHGELLSKMASRHLERHRVTQN